MAGLGLGIGAFIGGMREGIDLRRGIDQALTERKTRKMERQAMASATAARDADIAKGISRGVTPDTQQPTFTVGGQSFGDEASARQAASKSVAPFMDYYMKTAVPELVEGYMRTGQTDKALAYQKWMESASAKQGLRHWATAARAASRGDTGQFLKSMTAAYNTPGYADDGVTAMGGEEIKDKDGTVTGLKLRFKGADGKEFDQEFHGMEDVYRSGIHMLSPENVFEQGMSSVKAAESARAKAAQTRLELGADISKANHDATLKDRLAARADQRTLNRDAIQHGYDMDRTITELQMRAALKVSEDSGEKVEDVQKGIQAIVRQRAESDFNFAKLSPEEQTQQAVRILQSQRSSARGILGGGSSAVNPGGTPSLY